MVLSRWGLKLALTFSFLSVSVWVLALGDQRAAISHQNPKVTFLPNVLQADGIERSLLVGRDPAISKAKLNQLKAELARRAPLSPVPYEISLSEAFEQNDHRAAERFAAHVISRQPRSLSARLFYFNAAAKSKEPERVIREYERLFALNSLDRNRLNSALIGTLIPNGFRKEIKAYLKTNPASGVFLVRQLISEMPLDADLPEIVVDYPQLKSEHLHRLVMIDEIGKALEVGKKYYNKDVTESPLVPFNSSFEIREEAHPFNWEITSSVAEYLPSGGLHIAYAGNEFLEILRQVVSLDSGWHNFSVTLDGRIPPDSGSFEWQVVCLAEVRVRVATIQMALESNSELVTIQEEFFVPESNCDFQTVRLIGRPGLLRRASNVELQTLEIYPTIR